MMPLDETRAAARNHARLKRKTARKAARRARIKKRPAFTQGRSVGMTRS